MCYGSQVMELHQGARFLHIGCDEVFQMGECRRCRSQMRETLFLSHVARVASFVRSRYGAVTPIIWDDMLRHLSPQSLDEFRIGELVEPMVRNWSSVTERRAASPSGTRDFHSVQTGDHPVPRVFQQDL